MDIASIITLSNGVDTRDLQPIVLLWSPQRGNTVKIEINMVVIIRWYHCLPVIKCNHISHGLHQLQPGRTATPGNFDDQLGSLSSSLDDTLINDPTNLVGVASHSTVIFQVQVNVYMCIS